jgi:hypothetical protein
LRIYCSILLTYLLHGLLTLTHLLHGHCRYLAAVVDEVIPGLNLKSGAALITIEGPSGSGKSTLCKRLALDLACAQLQYLNSVMDLGVGVSHEDKHRVKLVVGGVTPMYEEKGSELSNMGNMVQMDAQRKKTRQMTRKGASRATTGAAGDTDGQEAPVLSGVEDGAVQLQAVMNKYNNAVRKEQQEAATKMASRAGRPDFFLPLVVPVGELDNMITRTRIRSKLHERDLLTEYIKDKYGEGSPAYEILVELHACHRLVIMFDGLDEARGNSAAVLRYFLQTLVEGEYPLLILTAASSQIPEEVRVGAQAVNMCPLDFASQQATLQILKSPDDKGDSETSAIVKACGMVSAGFPVADVTSNPMMLSQLLLAIQCGLPIGKLKIGARLVSQLMHNAFKHSLYPRTGRSSKLLASLEHFREGNALEVPFVDFEAAAVNDLRMFTRCDATELFYRIAYDTHQRKSNLFSLEDMEAVATDEQLEAGLVKKVLQLVHLNRLPLFRLDSDSNEVLPPIRMPHMSSQHFASMGFMEMEFGATIDAFASGTRGAGTKTAKAAHEDSELQELVELIFTEESGKVPYSTLKDSWWTAVLDCFLAAATPETKKPVIAVLAQRSPVNATAALSRAVYAGDRLIVQALIQSHVSVVVDPTFSSPDPRDGTLPLHRLCGANFPQELLILAMVDVYRDALTKKDFQNRVPIHWACMGRCDTNNYSLMSSA